MRRAFAGALVAALERGAEEAGDCPTGEAEQSSPDDAELFTGPRERQARGRARAGPPPPLGVGGAYPLFAAHAWLREMVGHTPLLRAALALTLAPPRPGANPHALLTFVGGDSARRDVCRAWLEANAPAAVARRWPNDPKMGRRVLGSLMSMAL